MRELEGYLVGKAIDEEMINGAAELAVKKCQLMGNNKYKVQELKVMLERALLRLK